MKSLLTPLLTALVLAGCASVPAIDTSTLPATPATFKEGGRWTQTTPAEAAPRGEWWKHFNDPVMNDLVEPASRSNTTIRVAAARLEQARAFVRAARADQLPDLRLAAGASRQHGLPLGCAGSATQSDPLGLDRRRAGLEHALAVLVGETATSFSLPESPWSTALPVIPPVVPSTVLARRPDVSAAQSALLAAQAGVGVAKAAWLPDIALTASGGYASPEIGDIFKWSARAWGVAALLSTPIFDGGRHEAGVRSATAEMDAQLAGYRERLLVAFRDVEDQLAALRLLAEQSDAQARAVASAARTTSLSDARCRNGFVSQLDLLDARRSELRNRRQALQVRSAQYQATVGLVRALGGGWETQS